MSCNGCRILRKGCNDNCILRESILCIDSPHAQANATLFVAKFFGRAGLVSFLSSVSQSQRPALFQSLLFEACGRTVNPVNGAVGLMWTGNWHVCQSAVETVLRGGVLRPLPEFEVGSIEGSEDNCLYASPDLNKWLKASDADCGSSGGLELGLTTAAAPPARMTGGGRRKRRNEKKRQATPMSEESETTTLESEYGCHQHLQLNSNDYDNDSTKLLQLFS